MTSYLENKPYLVDAVIGNGRFLASALDTGRIVRIWWPHVDIPQHADTLRAGLRLAGEGNRTSWFDGKEDGWQHRSGYRPQSNVFAVEASSDRLPLQVSSAYYAVPGEDVLVFDHVITNAGATPASFSFVFYSAMRTAESPYYHTTQFNEGADAIVHFRHRYYFSASSANVCTKFQSGFAWENAQTGELNGDGIQMATDGAMEWTFADVAPGASVRVPVYLTAGHRLEEALGALAKAKATSPDVWLAQTDRYWADHVAAANACPIDQPDLKDLYERSVLMMKLMSDEATGSIIAAPEFDERFSRCGGYAYCWGRDAAFITTALDKAGLTDMSTRFYEWTLTAQDPDGSWQQRHYHDGSLAPSWGLQIDEGASILWGMYQHYLALSQDAQAPFLGSVWEAVRKGAEYLLSYRDPDNGLPLASRDLWEEREGQHTYSSAAVYAGMTAAASFSVLAGEPALAERLRQAADRIAEAIKTLCWNEQGGVFYRGVNLTVTPEAYARAAEQGLAVSQLARSKGYVRHRLAHDPIVDVSLLGCAVPFAVVPPDHDQALRTAEAVERALTVPGVGGIKRYENDAYIGGNPWILTTLWLAQYRAANRQLDEARRLLDWAVRHRTPSGLLPEQVDRETGAAAWVVPLTWSHAMFILTVHMVAELEASAGTSAEASATR
ncbi:glycoside hydrolase family 15 protein [Cohnella nanjingensis]|uniref:Glycoside hydrolase family 15 n=1 Tax=Cohnella nanjingensis TaxID=1387779 RepID=A0A7X0VED4_9BACL|nr:glycoside hydrolase family 15 protein [Cohnella nanjingensis]MBB6670163.1 glycoside hydrolase family 15 [Cohnella nanjingensis]